MLNRKALGLDGIQNEVLKATRKVLAPAMAGIFSAYLEIGYFLTVFRETLTVVLRKEGKADYSLLSSYRPIALENTRGKVLEKLVIERLLEVLERNSLLLNTQFSARKHRSVNLALALLTEATQTV